MATEKFWEDRFWNFVSLVLGVLAGLGILALMGCFDSSRSNTPVHIYIDKDGKVVPGGEAGK